MTDGEVEYRDIPDCLGYRAGDDGSIWTCWRRKGRGMGRGSISVMSPSAWRKLKQSVSGECYARVTIKRFGVRVSTDIHRLILLAFVGPRPKGMQAAHENGDRSDPRLCNLSYKTPSANQLDRNRHGTGIQGENNPRSKLTNATVMAIRADYIPRKFGCVKLARKYGVSKRTIHNVLRGLGWTHV